MSNTSSKIKAFWWNKIPNYGDLITPYLIGKITNSEVELNQEEEHLVAIGSILGYANEKSILWGTGSFGTETKSQIPKNAQYLAVRGPLTRNLIRMHGISCPAIYGDPALLLPEYYWPGKIDKEFELGIVFRHSEEEAFNKFDVPGVLKINLKNENVEHTTDQILQCKRIATTSLHGLIIADAYDVPNAWIDSYSPYGLHHKYYDYLLSVDKVRNPCKASILKNSNTLGKLINELNFDARKIKIDLSKLKKSFPYS